MVSVLGFAFFRKFCLEFGAITSGDAGNDGVDLIGIKLAHVLHIAQNSAVADACAEMALAAAAADVPTNPTANSLF